MALELMATKDVVSKLREIRGYIHGRLDAHQLERFFGTKHDMALSYAIDQLEMMERNRVSILENAQTDTTQLLDPETRVPVVGNVNAGEEKKSAEPTFLRKHMD